MAIQYVENKPRIDPRELYDSEEEAELAKNLYTEGNMAEIIETYLQQDIDKEYKKSDIIKEFWAILGRTIPLSFIGDDDEEEFEILFEQAKLNYIMKVPAYKFTFNDMIMLDQLKIYFKAALKRSIGRKGHIVNERTMQSTAINQVIRSNTENMGSPTKGGVLNWIKKNF